MSVDKCHSHGVCGGTNPEKRAKWSWRLQKSLREGKESSINEAFNCHKIFVDTNELRRRSSMAV